MRSEEFFPDTSVLPTHNSHAVESQLHRIPGLAEHFLYSNDDMFFGRPVGPELFFSPGGVTKFIEAATRIGLGESHPARSGFENAARVNRALLQDRFGKVTTRHLEHTAAPMRKSVLRELEAEFPEDFTRTAASRFRSATDISVTNSLYHYYALMTGHAVVQTQAGSLYVETTLRPALRQMDPAAQAPRPGHVLPERRQLPRDHRRGAGAARSPSSWNCTSRLPRPWERESQVAGASASPGSAWSSVVHGTLAEYPLD